MKTRVLFRLMTCIGLFICSTMFAAEFQRTNVTIINNQLVLPELAEHIQWEVSTNTLERFSDIRSISIQKDAIITVSYELDGKEVTKVFRSLKAATGTKVKVVIIGDSTAAFYDSSRYPREGWAMEFQPFFNTDSVEVVNLALSGRSSKSFYTDANGWVKALAELGDGDYVFIQFGHNDAKSDEERHTDPYSTYQEYLTKYINEARAEGAIPVLVTSINRNSWSGSSISLGHGDYPAAMIDLGQTLDVPVIDMTTATKIRFEELGESYVTNSLFNNLPANTYFNYKDGNEDDTHLQVKGAYEVAQLIADTLAAPSSYQDVFAKLTRSLKSTGYLDVTIHPLLAGYVAGDGAVALNETTVLSANSYGSYQLKSWEYNGETYEPTEELSLVFEQEENAVTANFDITYDVVVYVQPTYKGTIDGDDSYFEGDTVKLVAHPKTGYDFDGWFMQDSTLLERDTTYSFIMGAEKEKLVARFIELPTAIQTSILDENLRIYPNPVSEMLTIQTSILLTKIELFSPEGRTIKTISPTSTTTNIDVNDLASGSYIVSLRLGKQTESKLIVIE